MNTVVLILLLSINCIYPVDVCINLNASLVQNIENNGFHNKISWLLEVSSSDIAILTKSKSELALHLNINSGMFVNPDEVADLKRLEQLSVYIDQDINTEISQSEAQNHNVFIFLPSYYDEKLLVTLPLHLRYQLAQLGGGFGRVILPKPSLLLYAPVEIGKVCDKYAKVEGPCSSKDLDKCMWRNITYQALFEEVELPVPIGNLDHFPVVAISTLLLGCIGCIYILSILSSRRQ